MFYGYLELPELDKIQTIKGLWCIKYNMECLCLMFLRLIFTARCTVVQSAR